MTTTTKGILNDKTKFTNEVAFNYNAEYDLAVTGDQAALDRLCKHYEEISAEYKERVLKFETPTSNQHRINQGNYSLRSIYYAGFVSDLHKAQQTDDTKERAKILKRWQSHNITKKPYMGAFSIMDIVHLLHGVNRNNSNARYRGMENMNFPGYGLLTPHERGFLLSINGEMILLPGEVAHKVLAHAAMEPTTTRFQHVPYTQGGVFPTRSKKNVNPDGITFVLKRYEFFDVQGVSHTFNNIRVSCTHALYKTLVYSVAYARGLGGDQNDKFKPHADITELLFGAQDHIIQDLTQFYQWWMWYTACYTTDNDNSITPKPEKLIAKQFDGHASFFWIRGMHCLDDIRDPKKVHDGLIAYEIENVKRADEATERRAQQAEQRAQQQKRVVAPTQSEDDLEEELTRYLNEQDQ
jgi:hypothetical protein